MTRKPGAAVQGIHALDRRVEGRIRGIQRAPKYQPPPPSDVPDYSAAFDRWCANQAVLFSEPQRTLALLIFEAMRTDAQFAQFMSAMGAGRDFAMQTIATFLRDAQSGRVPGAAAVGKV